MDKITKGMTEAGRHPQECCTKQDGLLRRMAHSFRSIAERVGNFLKGKEAMRPGSAR